MLSLNKSSNEIRQSDVQLAPSKFYCFLNLSLTSAHIIDVCVLVNFSCADWLVPGLPAMVYNPVVLFFICETNNTVL